MQNKREKGFTLLEILLVIAAIGILAAIVLIAINPNKQLAQARDTARQSDINTIQKALDQYLIETGAYPASVSTTPGYICNTGIEQVGGATNCSGRVDLRVLVPNYIASIPRDTQATGTSTGYNVAINSDNNKIVVQASLAERKLIVINPLSIVRSGLVLNLDAGNTASYLGSGTTWTDLSGNGNNGTLTNGPTYNSANGGSLVFDGVDDRVIIPNNASLNATNSITLSSWFKLNGAVTAEMGLLRKDNQWQLGLISTTGIRCLVLTTGITGWTAANDTVYPFAIGNWYNMVMTYDGNIMSIFVNNILVRSATVTGTIGVTTNSIQIANWAAFLNGNIANTTIYNRSLSSTEVSQNFNALRGRYGL